MDFSWLAALTQSGLIIVSITVIFLALIRFGILDKLISKGINLDVLDTMNKLLNQLDEKIERLIEHDKKQDERLNQMHESLIDICYENYKKAIYDESMPLFSRMISGIKYVKQGGNGKEKEYLMDTIAPKDKEQWNSLCRLMDLTDYCV
jgi:hypothetical protein